MPQQEPANPSGYTFTPHSRKSKFRRMVTPLTILLVAIPVIWWGVNRDNARREQIRENILALCNLAGEQKLKPSDVYASNEFVQAEIYRQLIAMTAKDWKKSADTLAISVAHGDPAPHPDLAASHTATISIDNTPRIGLRIQFDPSTNRPMFTGYFDPQSVSN
ncbi:MAG TPA: hypothetical protein VG711_05760 [Phycisphaerales bacterium]|nr:hypothetical protein [Phycisphaerales bacterium]